jgi:DUF4097 and DUF4098 domain-containing protein YvlB
VTVNTSFGPILLDGVGGAVTVGNQNGSVEVTANGSNCRPITIRTSFSPIRLRLPANASYRVSANTSFGKISSELPINASGTLSEGSISGMIGSGQCELRINNNNGDIAIQKY